MAGYTLQKIDTGFPCGTSSLYYMKKFNFSVLIKHTFKKNCKSVRFHGTKLHLCTNETLKMKSL